MFNSEIFSTTKRYFIKPHNKGVSWREHCLAVVAFGAQKEHTSE